MDAGIVVALCVLGTLAFVGGVAAGIFGGMWWQARQTASVWEKAYTHVREQIPVIKHDTYNTRGDPPPPPATTTQPPKDRVRVQAATGNSEFVTQDETEQTP